LLTDDKKGGPIDPILAFEIAFMATYPEKMIEAHPLFKVVKNVSKFEGYDQEEYGHQKEAVIDDLFKPKRELMTCDEVFALFLAYMCR